MRSIKEIYEDVVKETSFERDMDPNKKVTISGVKGMKSTSFKKVFQNMKAYEKWTDSDEAENYEVHRVYQE